MKDILTMKSQENNNFGENTEEAHAIKGYIHKVKIEEQVSIQSQKIQERKMSIRGMLVCGNNQDKETKDLTNDFITPDLKNRSMLSNQV